MNIHNFKLEVERWNNNTITATFDVVSEIGVVGCYGDFSNFNRPHVSAVKFKILGMDYNERYPNPLSEEAIKRLTNMVKQVCEDNNFEFYDPTNKF